MANDTVDQRQLYAEDDDNFASGLIDTTLLQQLQDHFCQSHVAFLSGKGRGGYHEGLWNKGGACLYPWSCG